MSGRNEKIARKVSKLREKEVKHIAMRTIENIQGRPLRQRVFWAWKILRGTSK